MAVKKRKGPPTGRSTPNDERALRDHVLYVLRGGGAHVTFEQAVEGLPPKQRGLRPKDLSLSPWRLLEHLRLAQQDILEFCRDPKHVSPNWPEGYWPTGDGPKDGAAWDKSLKAFRSDLEAMQDLVGDSATNLFARIPHGDGQTVLREALLVADHNAYHVGQLVLVRRLLGSWSGA
ncbi:MAG TPA: DinB family protein [Vicinamibacteria bacterium]|jgi:hypothetical protein|nr:DinB family protein [Vicinamibacteria bacterium]